MPYIANMQKFSFEKNLVCRYLSKRRTDFVKFWAVWCILKLVSIKGWTATIGPKLTVCRPLSLSKCSAAIELVLVYVRNVQTTARGENPPAKPFQPAREDILPIMKKIVYLW